MNVLYTGTGLSGRTTSIESIARLASEDVRQGPRSEWRLAVEGNSGVVEVDSSRSDLRSWLVKNISECLRDPRFAREIEVLRSLDGMIFVVDSQQSMLASGRQFLERTIGDLRQLNRAIARFQSCFN